MQKHRFAEKVMVGAALALAFAITASASVNRTFVSTTGNDANVSVNCSASANCRSFAAALSVTNAGGEVVVVNSGGYGPATISQPVTITATGIDASVTETGAGLNGLTINTTGNVTINGLNLFGGGTGNDGILVQQVGFLRIYNTLVQGFANDGIHFTGGSNLAIYNSKFNDNGHDGLLMQTSGGRAYIDGSDFENNAFAGADSAQGKIDIANSNAHYNQYGFFANGGTVALYNDRAIYNATGIAASGTAGGNGPGNLYFADCLLADNTTAWSVGSGGVLSGSSPGTTLVVPGQATSGTLTAAQTLE
ncbi:MAG: right-handed parallel beta-helix repeat-containing protein [Terracidiphilus sp.]